MLLSVAFIAVLAAGLTAPAAAAPPERDLGGLIAGVESTAAPRAWTQIMLHHSATSTGDVASIDAAHRRQRDRSGNPWLGIGYHFVVGNGRQMADGEVQSTFRWLKQLPGAHAGTRAHNEQAIGICLIGNFDESAPTDRQIAALRVLVRSLAQRYAIPRERLLRHFDVQATRCPGRKFPWELVRADLPPAAEL